MASRRQAGAAALAAWFAVSVAGPLLARGLDARIAGAPAGFWYAELCAVPLLVAVLAAYVSAANGTGDEEDGG